MADKIFAEGVFIKEGKYGIKVSINQEKFAPFFKAHVNEKGYLNLDILKSKGGNWYCSLDTWKPEQQIEASSNPANDLPF